MNPGRQVQTHETTFQAASDHPLHSRSLHATDELCTAIFEQASDGIFVADQGGQVLEVNQQMCRMLGYTRTELLQLSLPFLIPDEDPARNLSLPLLNDLSTHKPTVSERRLRCKDGAWRLVEIRAQLVTDGRCVGFMRDITEHKLAEDALKAHEEQLNHQANLLQNVTDAIIATDLSFHITSWNRGAEVIYGRRAAEVIGTDLRALVQDEKNPEQTEEAIQHLWQLGSWKGEVTQKHTDGSTIYLLSSLSLLKDSAGAVVGTVSVNRDISKRRRAEEASRQSEERFNRAFHASPAALSIVHAAELCIIDVNDSFLHIFGYRREEMIGRTLFELKLIVEVDETAKLIEQLRRHERVRDDEMTYRTKAGEIIQVLFSAEPVELDGENYILAMAVDITARKKAEERLKLALAATQMGVWEWEVQTDKLFWSPECYAIHGLKHFDDARSAFWEALHPEDAARAIKEFASAIAGQTTYNAEFRIVHPGGEVRWVAMLGKSSYDKNGNPLRAIGTIQDITERIQVEEAQVQLEDQLRQAQKMETIGRLAGGIAHDFNNLLTVIQGYCDLILAKMAGDNPMRTKLEQIQKAGKRATTLTRQLLAFSRKQMLSPVVLDLNNLITNLQDMLERLIGEDILLTVLLQPDLWPVTADSSQLEQVIMNLVVNARDAMPTGGLLTIETSNVYRDDVHHNGSIKSESAKAAQSEALTGPCVMVAVTDTGCGMDEQIRAHLFEPFFTTKEQGKGTGLGLATVYGIVKQSSGDIFVYSEVDQGSTFKIYLPATATATDQQVMSHSQASPSQGNETILLVEDEEMVRKLVQTALEEKGYTILEARDVDDAFSLAMHYAGVIDLLVTDVVMPQISGRELAEYLLVMRPEMKVLFTSGYTDDAVVRHGLLTAEVEFLQKPFSSRALALKVREVLDK